MKIRWLIIGAIGAVFLWVGYSFFQNYNQHKIILEGEITAQRYTVSSKIPARIASVDVKRGEVIHKGQKVFTLYSPEVEAKLKQALAARDAAQAQKEQADKGAREEQIEALRQQYLKATAAKELYEKSYKRIQNLYHAGVLAEQKKDELFTKYKAALYTQKAAKELYMMAKKGARAEVKKAADAQARVYDGKVDEVKAFEKEQVIYSYYDAEVESVMLHEGEIAPSGFPVVVLLDRNNSWLNVSVREDYLHAFKQGNVLNVYLPALEKEYKFKVTYIAPEGSYASWSATQTLKGYELKSFAVELRPIKPIKGLRVGMSGIIKLDEK